MKITQIRACSIGQGYGFFKEQGRETLNGSALVAPATAFTLQMERNHPIKDEGFLFGTMEKDGYFRIWFFMVKDNSITELETNEKYTSIAEVEKIIHSVESAKERNRPNRLVYTTAHGLEVITKAESGIRMAGNGQRL